MSSVSNNSLDHLVSSRSEGAPPGTGTREAETRPARSTNPRVTVSGAALWLCFAVSFALGYANVRGAGLIGAFLVSYGLMIFYLLRQTSISIEFEDRTRFLLRLTATMEKAGLRRGPIAEEGGRFEPVPWRAQLRMKPVYIAFPADGRAVLCGTNGILGRVKKAFPQVKACKSASMAEDGPRKRPFGVWVVAIVVFWICWTSLLTMALKGAGAAYSIGTEAVSALVLLMNLAGAIALFLLRRFALYLFSGALLLNVACYGFYPLRLSSLAWRDVLGYGIGAVLLGYIYRLSRSRVLQ